MTDETQLANSIALLYEQREEALADRRRLEQEFGAAKATIDGMRRALEEARAEIELLNLAADQYSESRDQWMLKAKAAEADAAVLRQAIKRMSDLIGRAVRPPEIVYAAHEIAADMLTQPHSGAALLAELAAAHAVLAELRAVADAPGEDIRATIDAYFAKEYPHA